MMSIALTGCLIFSASDASAQGRSRTHGGSTSSRSQSAAVSRSNNSSAPTVSRSSRATPQVSSSRSQATTSRSSQATPQVSRSSSSQATTSPSSQATTSRSSQPTPQVSRSSSSQATTSRSSQATPQVSRNSSSQATTSRSSQPTPQVSRSTSDRPAAVTSPSSGSTGRSGGATKRGGATGNDHGSVGNPNNGSTGIVSRSEEGHTKQSVPNSVTKDRTRTGSHSATPDRGNDNHGGKPGGKPDNGGKPGGKPDNGGKPGGGHGNSTPGGHGYNPNNRYDYGSHHYRDEFSWNYRHHNWGRPLPPPARAHRPAAPWRWHRPTIPAGWYPYASAPVIDRILGLMFGSLYEASLDHLYYSGYFIDGYDDGIIFLRDVPMLNLYWPDVMLNYEYNRLVNAQFIYHTIGYDTARFNRVARSLNRIYGPPVYRDGMTISWYGGNNTGYVTLSLSGSYGDYYTVMSIGY